MTLEQNPYTPPLTSLRVEPSGPIFDDELADRLVRLEASIVDGILTMIVIGPVMYATGFFQRVRLQQTEPLEQLAMTLLGMAAMLALNGYLLLTRGQTLGKKLLKIQIVNARDGRLLPFVKVYVYRYLWMLPPIVLATLLYGAADKSQVNLLSLVDVLLIFGVHRRCLHDYIAGSKVVVYQDNRKHIE